MTNKNNNENDIKTSKKTKASKKQRMAKFLKYTLYTFIVLALTGVSLVAFIMYSTYKEIGEVNLDAINKAISRPSVMYDSNGKVVDEFKSSDGRIMAKFEDVPQDLKDAIMAIEDTEFYKHNGFNFKRTLGALMHNLKVGYSAQGGSTLTQQLVKGVFLTNEKTIERKIKELCYSLEIEKKLTKNQIFEAYLNTIYLGKGNYGVASAARNYFNKDLKDLTLAECALLGGITKFPTRYDAYKAVDISLDDDLENIELVFYELAKDVSESDQEVYDKLLELGRIDNAVYTALSSGKKTLYKAVFNQESKKRQEVVLKRMLDVGYITEEEYKEAKAEKIRIDIPEPKNTEVSSYFKDYVKEEVVDILVAQDYTREEALDILYRGGLQIHTTLDLDMQKIAEKKFNDYENFPSSKKDSKGIPQPQGAMVIMDYRTGGVKVMIGGRGVQGSGLYNRAINPRQPGSTIKPLAAYLPALINKNVYPSTIVDDSPMVYKGDKYPNNYMKKYRGDITMKEAVMWSSNVVASRTLLSLDKDEKKAFRQSIDFMRELGITTLVDREQSPSHHDEHLPLVLGGLTNGISPLEIANAYGTIANEGVYVKANVINKIVDSSGKSIFENKIEKKNVFSPQVAFQMTDMLEAVVEQGTGTPAKSTNGIAVAGKTGTTSDNKDGWFVGYTPYYVASVWLGSDMPEEIPNISRYAVRLWGNVMNTIQEKYSAKKFFDNKEIVEVSICSETGLLSNKKDKKLGKDITVKMFKEDVPTKSCTKHEYTAYDSWYDNMLEEKKKQEEEEKEESSSSSGNTSSSSSSSSSGNTSSSSSSDSSNSTDSIDSANTTE